MKENTNNSSKFIYTENDLEGITIKKKESEEYNTETHPFEPFVPSNITVLIVGSFPGVGATTKNHWYYSAARNQFWKIMKEVYPIASLETVEDKKSLFAKAGIGITDIILSAQRSKGGNNDADLIIKEYNDQAVREILRQNPSIKIYFTSHFVERAFNTLFPDFKDCEYLPSPSPIFRRMSLSEKVQIYKSKLPTL